ncbi:MAG TPA: hypothetical protein VLA97_13570 [Nocardioidaceae bacterium]|nr:hypothetical protein [Nocardioidaceae bacterium]
MAEPLPSGTAPAFYARRGGALADWWTLLHPPYTLWHLSYVALGAALVPRPDWAALALSVLAFFLAVGLAAHALDELSGRPLGTAIPSSVLWAVSVLALTAAVVLGLVGVFWWGPVNWPLAVAIPIGALLVVGYNLELFGGRLHTDTAFALGWGGFPVAVGFLAQSPALSPGLLLAAVATALAGVGTAGAQRHLSTAARQLRRRSREVTGSVTGLDGQVTPLDRDALLRPLEGALRAMAWAVPAVAAGALLARW